VLFQPVLQEIQQLDRHGHSACLKIGLKLQYLTRQRGVFFLVFWQIRVPVLPHQTLLMRKMHRRVLDQPVQNPRQRGFALSRAHRLIQLVRHRKQVLMLCIDTLNPDTVFSVPLEHVSHIGAK